MGGPPRANAGRLSVAGCKAGPMVGSAPCNPPLMGWQALDTDPRGDCVACMPCGAWDGGYYLPWAFVAPAALYGACKGFFLCPGIKINSI